MTKKVPKVIKATKLEKDMWFRLNGKTYQYSGKDGRGHCIDEKGNNVHIGLNSYVTVLEKTQNENRYVHNKPVPEDVKFETEHHNYPWRQPMDKDQIIELQKLETENKPKHKRVWRADSVGGIHIKTDKDIPKFPLDQLKIEDNTNPDKVFTQAELEDIYKLGEEKMETYRPVSTGN